MTCNYQSHPLSSNTKNHRGQGLSEYLIIVALIAVAAIGVVGFMGGTVSNQMASMAQEIAGQDGGAATQSAQADADNAENTAGAKTMADFATAN